MHTGSRVGSPPTDPEAGAAASAGDGWARHRTDQYLLGLVIKMECLGWEGGAPSVGGRRCVVMEAVVVVGGGFSSLLLRN